jgi:hypothetical protein
MHPDRNSDAKLLVGGSLDGPWECLADQQAHQPKRWLRGVKPPPLAPPHTIPGDGVFALAAQQQVPRPHPPARPRQELPQAARRLGPRPEVRTWTTRQAAPSTRLVQPHPPAPLQLGLQGA